jgi:hypothetical protein
MDKEKSVEVTFNVTLELSGEVDSTEIKEIGNSIAYAIGKQAQEYGLTMESDVYTKEIIVRNTGGSILGSETIVDDYEEEEYKPTQEQIDEFIVTYGSTDEDIRSLYIEEHDDELEDDELEDYALGLDYEWLTKEEKWIKADNMLYTSEEAKIAEYLIERNI